MATKIRIRVGDVEVEYEGAEAFLDKKLLHMIAELSKIYPQAPPSVSEGGEQGGGLRVRQKPGTLPAFLNQSKARSPQWKCFLATAQWLHAGGAKMLRTADVTKALKDNQQKKLANASGCLRQNVGKGYCEKSGSQFFVTEDGRNFLG